MHVLFDQQTDPKQRKKEYQKNGKGDPTGGRDLSFEPGHHIAHAARAAIGRIHHLRLAEGQRLRLILNIPRELNIQRLHLVYLLGFSSLGFRGLKLIRLPRVWARRRIIILRRGLLDQKLRPAKPAEITFSVIELSAILTLGHICSGFVNRNYLRIIPEKSSFFEKRRNFCRRKTRKHKTPEVKPQIDTDERR